MGRKRQREDPTEVSKRTEVFEDLAHLDESTRLKAAETLLTEFVPGADKDQLKEILRRLIRGLCSGRKAARLGFSVALTELLSTVHGSSSSLLDVSYVVETLISQTQVGGGTDGQENRDHQIGRLFGAEAILQSGILYGPQLDGWVSNRLLDLVFELAKKKPWLREQCGFVLSRSFENATEVDSRFAQSTIDKLQSSGLAKTPEGVALWIVISQKYPSVKLPAGVWRENTPLCGEEKSKLALILKEASASDIDNADSDRKAPQRGSWSTNLHFAWIVILNHLMHAEKPKWQRYYLTFGEFWDVCVEGNLFAGNSSDERKYWGLVLFQRGLDLATLPEQIEPFFSTGLVRCLENQLASEGRYLNRAAEKARRTITNKARESPGSRIAIIKALLFNGHISFDRISKTQTIQEMLSDLDESTYSVICEIYNSIILHPADDQKLATQVRQIASDQLLNALKTIKLGPEKAQLDVTNSGPAIRAILSLLATIAYFDVNSYTRITEITTATRNCFRARLSSCLTHLIVNANDSAAFAVHVTNVISKREDVPSEATLLLEAESDIQEVLDRALKITWRLSKDLEGKGNWNRSFLKSGILLISVVFLQVHDGDLDAVGMLEELNETFSVKNLKENDQQDGQSAVALIGILLALAAKPSKLFRRLSQQVFESITGEIDEDALHSMLKILNAKENSEGQDELFDVNDEDAALQSYEEHDSEDSDVEILNEDGGSRNEQSDDDTSNAESSSADEEGEDAPDEDLAAFDAKLAQALGTRLGNEDLEAEDGETSDEDMNDEEMEALDEHLANVFREQKKVASKKTERKDAKKNVVDFKCRVLELLEIFVRKQHKKPLTMSLLPALLGMLRTTSNPQVSQKTSDLLRDYSRLSKGKELPHVEDSESVVLMLESIHREALESGSNAHANACSQASLLLVRTLAGHDRDALHQIIDIYTKTYEVSHKKALSEKNFRVKMSFFVDFQNWMASSGKQK